MNNYYYLLIGGDKRQEHLYEILNTKKSKVDKIFFGPKEALEENFKKISDANVIILPIPSTTDGKYLYAPNIDKKIHLNLITEKISNNTVLFTGGENTLFTASKAKKVINLLADESLTLKNAMATAEATLSVIINNTEHTVFDSRVLITGYGRIAKILTKYLLALNAKVSICARKEAALTEAKLCGAVALGFSQLKESLTKYVIIINTVPMELFKKDELEKINNKSLIIDLASKPGGIDFKTADDLGLKTIHALSLPGKYSPKSAAEFIEEVISNTLT